MNNKQKLFKTISLLTLLLGLSRGVDAADGTLYFNGEIVAQGCDITLDSQTIELGKISVSTLKNTNDQTSSGTMFTIRGTNCPEGLSGITFSGAEMPGSQGLFALTNDSNLAVATGVGVGIYLEDHTTRVRNGVVSAITLPNGQEELNQTYFAKYVPIIGGNVTPGKANASVTYTLQY